MKRHVINIGKSSNFFITGKKENTSHHILMEITNMTFKDKITN